MDNIPLIMYKFQITCFGKEVLCIVYLMTNLENESNLDATKYL